MLDKVELVLQSQCFRPSSCLVVVSCSLVCGVCMLSFRCALMCQVVELEVMR